MLVYVANEYTSNRLNDMCQQLTARGVVILPVFVGTNINFSQLTLLADTQKTGISTQLDECLRFTFDVEPGLADPGQNFCRAGSTQAENPGQKLSQTYIVSKNLDL